MTLARAPKDPISLPPTIEGGSSRAWLIDMAALRKTITDPVTIADDSVVGSWVVECVWAHPFWHSYIVTVIHLRDLPGQSKPPLIKFPGATHEIVVYALNPDLCEREKVIKGEDFPRYLTPQNYIGQFTTGSDAQAMELVEDAVRRICQGRLNPDTDARRQWVALFGDHYYRPKERERARG